MKPKTSYTRLKVELTKLLKSLKPDIRDDYRASEDPDDRTPAMCVTIGVTFAPDKTVGSWSYQTGDNSFTGGAYGHAHWGMGTLTRRSNSRELAAEIVSDAVNQLD